MTLGQIMFYGGIVGTVFSLLILFLSWGIFEAKKKKIRKQIEEEY